MFEGVSTTFILLILVALLLLLIFTTLAAVLIYSGLFISPEVSAGKPPFGKIALAYKFQKGPYKESGQLFTEAVIIAPEKQTLGIFYDDPKKVEASKLRYIAGSIIATDSEPIDEDLVKKFEEQGFKIINFPQVEHVVKTTFPYLTSLSIIIGVYKVYPRMHEYIEEKKLCAYPFLEYCDSTKIHYIAPLSKQEEFFVPECEERKNEDKFLSDLDETLDSTLSTVADSVQESTLESEADITPVDEKGAIDEKAATNLESQYLSGHGEGDTATIVSPKVTGNAAEDNNGNNSDVDGEDNSSSSSFEVVKNEAGDG